VRVFAVLRDFPDGEWGRFPFGWFLLQGYEGTTDGLTLETESRGEGFDHDTAGRRFHIVLIPLMDVGIEGLARPGLERDESDAERRVATSALEVAELFDQGGLLGAQRGLEQGEDVIQDADQDTGPVEFGTSEFVHLEAEMLAFGIVGLFEEGLEGAGLRGHGIVDLAGGLDGFGCVVLDGLPAGGGAGDLTSDGFDFVDLEQGLLQTFHLGELREVPVFEDEGSDGEGGAQCDTTSEGEDFAQGQGQGTLPDDKRGDTQQEQITAEKRPFGDSGYNESVHPGESTSPDSGAVQQRFRVPRLASMISIVLGANLARLAGQMDLAELVRRAGVVGAGGGGFPTHIKLAARADTVIANGAECEPLLHKDAGIMEHQARAMIEGVELAMDAVGARDGVIGVKAKKKAAVAAVEAACAKSRVRIELLGDYYPAGDEYDLVYTVTGRLIPPAGIPLDVGVVVCNVETFVNIAGATRNQPVTRKTVTLAGAVNRPATVTVPIGMSFRAAIEATGGFATDDPVYMIGGLMMGELSEDQDAPVTKTATGVVVLPRGHRLIQRRLTPPLIQNQIGKSACDQCRYCTEYCPRFLLGYALEPHQVMRSLAFTATGKDVWNDWGALCCACGLCTLYGCPEELYPKEACDQAKAEMRAAGRKWTGKTEVKPHPMRDGRRVPIHTLARKLHVDQYEAPAPLQAEPLRADRVRIPLKQHAGVANEPMVRAGDLVKEGQAVGRVPDKALGAIVHAPFGARVVAVNQSEVILENIE
jgi:Na+-translocating ferredoxin:NAD+ oxidoreductase RnfC subunit